MIHAEVYSKFKDFLPTYHENSEMYFPNGRNSVRVRMRNGEEFIFTYFGKHDWILRTTKNFLERKK